MDRLNFGTVALRLVLTFGAMGVVAPLATTSAVAQDVVQALAASIENAVIDAQAEAAAQGLDAGGAEALIQQRVQAVVALSGLAPAQVQAALTQAVNRLQSAGTLSAAAGGALTSVASAVGGGAVTGSTGSASGGSAIGGTSAGSTGGGGSDYRPNT